MAASSAAFFLAAFFLAASSAAFFLAAASAAFFLAAASAAFFLAASSAFFVDSVLDFPAAKRVPATGEAFAKPFAPAFFKAPVSAASTGKRLAVSRQTVNIAAITRLNDFMLSFSPINSTLPKKANLCAVISRPSFRLSSASSAGARLFRPVQILCMHQKIILLPPVEQNSLRRKNRYFSRSPRSR